MFFKGFKGINSNLLGRLNAGACLTIVLAALFGFKHLQMPMAVPLPAAITAGAFCVDEFFSALGADERKHGWVL
jgi:hypothetical protein